MSWWQPAPSMERLLQEQPRAGRALYVDMNSFFASVEQETKPELRGRPVGVCPFINDATCVIAASVEAKRCGVTTGTSVRVARQRCPGIQLISDDPGIYRIYHHRIVAALEATRCQVTVRGIDEALLIPPADLRGQAITVAHQVQGLINEVGTQLGCSIGIASNLFLAKMGTKLHKPRGLVEIRLEDLEALYGTLQLTDLYGISNRMSRQLERIGITDSLALYHAPYPVLKRAFGVNGERWYLRLRGYEVDQRTYGRHSMSHQTTIVPSPAHTRAEVASVASQLCYKVAGRVRKAELAATGVHLGLRFSDRTYWSSNLRTTAPFWDSRTLFSHIQTLLAQWAPGRPVRLVSVAAVNLMPQQATTASLFTAREQSERLSGAIDEIDQRFGRHAIAPAAQMLSRRMNDRVGFGNVG